jgi:hypothetical protein
MTENGDEYYGPCYEDGSQLETAPSVDFRAVPDHPILRGIITKFGPLMANICELKRFCVERFGKDFCRRIIRKAAPVRTEADIETILEMRILMPSREVLEKYYG